MESKQPLYFDSYPVIPPLCAGVPGPWSKPCSNTQDTGRENRQIFYFLLSFTQVLYFQNGVAQTWLDSRDSTF